MISYIKNFTKNISILLSYFLVTIISFSVRNNFDQAYHLLINILFNISYIFILFLFYKNSIKEEWQTYKTNLKKNLSLMIWSWIGATIFMLFCTYFLTRLLGTLPNNELAVREQIITNPLYMLFRTIIYAPIVEEIVFRKTIREIIPFKWPFIIISGLIFGYLHIAGMESGSLFIIPYAALGSTFAYIYTKTNSIFSSITMHSVHNSYSYLRFFILGGI